MSTSTTATVRPDRRTRARDQIRSRRGAQVVDTKIDRWHRAAHQQRNREIPDGVNERGNGPAVELAVHRTAPLELGPYRHLHRDLPDRGVEADEFEPHEPYERRTRDELVDQVGIGFLLHGGGFLRKVEV